MTCIRKGGIALLLALPLILVGCSDEGPEIAYVSLALADEPGDVDSVWVEIGEIYLTGGGSGRTTLLSEADAEGLGLIELTQLAGTTLELVSDVAIDAGNYGQLRFVVVGGVLEVEGGGVYTFNATHPHGLPATGSLQCPSCDTSGIKVLLPGEVGNFEGGTSSIVLLDFDVSQSFGHEAGSGWVMHPVIRGAELSFSGAVSGTVDVARDGGGVALVTIPQCPAGTPRDLSAFIPRAVAQTLVDDLGDPVTATAIVSANGSFSFPFLHPDAYDFDYVAVVNFGTANLTFVATDPGIVNVTDGANLTVTYTITSAVCA